jgi:amidohydrolase
MSIQDDLKRQVASEIDHRGDELIRVAQTILDHPEPGFRETRTSQLVHEKLQELSIPHRTGIALTGIKGYLEGTAGPGPTIGVMGELDSLIVLDHPKADPETAAAHACGHHAQIGMLLGVAAGIQAPGVLSQLSGRICLMAVPAEEFIEIEHRVGLKEQGLLEFLGGKSEFIRLGEFDDIDLAMMTHTTSNSGDGLLAMPGTNNAMVAKWIQFSGKAAHAGGSPQSGVNALNAAHIALGAIHAQRETFYDEDSIRIHPIITRGGAAVSSIPADVRIETFVRGRTLEAIADASHKVDRSLRAGAMAVGASVSITTLPGYLPIINDPNFLEVYHSNAISLVGQSNVGTTGHRTGSTDMGDVSHLLPVIHPYAGGATGTGHGDDYLIVDWENAVLTAAKAMAFTIIDLLSNGGLKAKEVMSRHKAPLNVKDYQSLLRSFGRSEVYNPKVDING